LVDPTTITSSKSFSIKSRNEKGEPTSMVRFSDNSTWKIGDFITNGTKMKGNIEGFELTVSEDSGEIVCWVKHTWSKVNMSLEDVQLIDSTLPSLFQIKEVVDFVINDARHTSTVNAVHFTENKVRYDLDVWIKKEGGNSSTRIYNVDSFFVEHPVFSASK